MWVSKEEQMEYERKELARQQDRVNLYRKGLVNWRELSVHEKRMVVRQQGSCY